jgi:hypothetical protein
MSKTGDVAHELIFSRERTFSPMLHAFADLNQ